jgi:hypothetical protein
MKEAHSLEIANILKNINISELRAKNEENLEASIEQIKSEVQANLLEEK